MSNERGETARVKALVKAVVGAGAGAAAGAVTVGVAGAVAVAVALSHRSRVDRPPGSRMSAIAAWLYSKKTFSRVFADQINDLQIEYIEAIGKGRPWHARWIRVRYGFAFMESMVLKLPVSMAKRIFEIWKSAS